MNKVLIIVGSLVTIGIGIYAFKKYKSNGQTTPSLSDFNVFGVAPFNASVNVLYNDNTVKMYATKDGKIPEVNKLGDFEIKFSKNASGDYNKVSVYNKNGIEITSLSR